ncbi:histidine kinase [Sphingomonas sp. Leaf33]|uniref:XrtA/PEP-CTERM system histidine kinase PrsK n=1 Tax=Sphingomonas sp. Leaf33 TaxID=1736215 RepID=UPI0006F8216D|nr:XrtA/PEP-CTERM system histidine kinase PrsK [Sphingomonas sp. Leaf33]KQN25867.1 histidine kinase [Sphingomonas sp. Leaf33]
MEQLTLWSHALAALLFAAVAFAAARGDVAGLPRRPLVVMFAIGAAWTLAVAGVGGLDPATRLMAGLHALAMLGVMAILHRRAAAQPLGLIPVYGVVAGVIVISTIVQILSLGAPALPMARSGIVAVATLLRMLVAVSGLVLVNNLAMARSDGAVRLLCAALAMVWGAELAVTTVSYLSGDWPVMLFVFRGVLLVLSAAVAALALRTGAHRPVAVSRTVAYQSFSLVAVAAYFAVLAAGTSALSAAGDYARIVQTAFVLGVTVAAVTLMSSPWLRAWAKVKIAKHLFTHRYDYRAEWLRFTGTLGAGEGDLPLGERVVKAIADLTMSDRGLLLVPEGDGLGVGARWNSLAAGGTADAGFVRHLTMTARILAFDDLRTDAADPVDLACVPQWMLDDRDIWAAVPMLHRDTLVGVVLLARPSVDRALDWEDFDLLKVAGRGVASYLAEARAQEALADTQRFDEFNRRTAFIVHDIKNLVSGLSLVARNAERHADNPDFRADMVATLQDSATKMTLLLGRLSAGPRGRAEPPVAVPLLDFVQRIAATRRAGHPIVAGGDGHAVALADPSRLDQIVAHLLSNAVEASPAAEPVSLTVSVEGERAVIAVIDRGCGMSPGFIRDRLFRPFASSKPDGFGIGAFEARQLAETMGGTVTVTSREGEGSTFRVILPAAAAIEIAA